MKAAPAPPPTGWRERWFHRYVGAGMTSVKCLVRGANAYVLFYGHDEQVRGYALIHDGGPLPVDGGFVPVFQAGALVGLTVNEGDGERALTIINPKPVVDYR